MADFKCLSSNQEKKNITKEKAETIKDNKIIYHYTSQSGLLGIIKSRCIWASDIRYLNDSNEFEYTIKLAADLFKEKESKGYSNLSDALKRLELSEIAPIYVASFSHAHDQLSQWRGYCPTTGGFVVGFVIDEIERLSKEQGFRFERCVYDEKRQRKILSKIIDKALELAEPTQSDNNQQCYDWVAEVTKKCGQARSNLLFDLLKLAPTFKDTSFSEEKEWRLILDGGFSQPGKTMFRTGKSMIIPYVEFGHAIAERNTRSPLKIKKIIIGPTPHKELSRFSILQLLKENNIDSCEVTSSEIPYRSW